MDMDDGTVWVRPDRPAAITAWELEKKHIEEEDDTVYCWCCDAHETDYIVDAVDDQLGECRVGVCRDCYHSCADAEGWKFVEEL